jgi:non-heme Fe2+,alpha-ketoglutarate-dependent halogenase
VRGEDAFHNFEDEQPPDADMSAAARAFHARVTGIQQQVLMRETVPTM